jgi:hypothetical protein
VDRVAPPIEAPPAEGGLPPLKPQTAPEPAAAPQTTQGPPVREAEPEPQRRASGLRTVLLIVVPLVLLAAIVAAVIGGSSGSSSRGTFLSLGFGDKGSTSLYRSQRVMRGYVQVSTGSQSPFELSMTEMDTVRVAARAGAATKLDLASNDWGSFNGQTLQPVAIDTSVVLGSDGRITSGGKIPLTTSQGNIGGMPGTDLFLPILPDHPVEAGDTWDVSYRRPFAIPDGGALEYQTTNKLVRFDSVAGTRTAVVSTTGRVPLDVTVDLAEVRRLAPDLVNQLITSLQLTRQAKFKYRGVVTYQLRSTLDTASHQLLTSRVNGTAHMRVTVSGVASSGSFTIDSGLTQATRRVS